ncbi:MAG: sensor histidine kinase [Planctomycetes bacterium]|nr:sensor histidine kinase [Planctomycetota bacterium]
MLLLAGQGYHCARQAVLDTAAERLAELTESRRQRLEMWLSERLADAAFLAACPAVRHECSADSQTSQTAQVTSAFLSTFATKYGMYEAIGLYDPGWHELAGVGTRSHGLQAFELSGIVEAVGSSPGPAAGRVHRHRDGRLGMHFGAAVRDGEQVTGYVLTALDEEVMQAILKDGMPTSTYRSYLVGRDGIMLTEAESSLAGAGLSERVASVGFKRAANDETGAAVYRDSRNREVVGGYAAIHGMDWILLVEQDAPDALAWLPELGWRALITSLLVSAAVVALTLRSARRMTAPLQQLANVARQVAHGDWEARVGPVSQYEVGSVATALNHMLDELATARLRVVQSETLAAMGEMSSAVVHEMRNPLSSIKLNLQAILKKLSDDPRSLELAEIAQAQVLRLERMFSDLLSLSRPLAMNFGVLPLQDTLVAALEDVAEQAGSERCSLHVQEPDPHLHVRIDPDRMRQALVNLLQNAIDAAGHGGEIVVVTRLEESRRRVLIEVADNGPGVSDDNLERLFQPFFTTRAGGTGLGLAMVRKIVEYHGGRVTAANRTDTVNNETGAVFRIELPHESEQS